MKAAIYIRVSTKEQKEKYSLPAQRKVLTDFCKSNGWEYRIYEEAGISGETIEARPQMIKLLEDAKAGKFENCVVIELERLSRSEDLFDWLTIRKIFLEHNIQVMTPTQKFDLTDADDTFLFFLFGSLSSREKQKTIKRMMRGLKEAARQGYWTGGQLPYGYATKRVSRTSSALVPDKKVAEIVKLIFSLRVEDDLGSQKIADKLNSLGVPTKTLRDLQKSTKYQTCGKWHAATVLKILRNPIYIGKRFYNKKEQIEPKFRNKPKYTLY